jgi:hypothetical protein
MQVLLYLDSGSETAQRVLCTAADIVPLEHLEQYEDVDAFFQRLRRPASERDILVVCVENNNFTPLQGLSEIAGDRHLIVVLDKNTKDGLIKAHRLHPRVVLEADDEEAQLSLLLDAVIRRSSISLSAPSPAGLAAC